MIITPAQVRAARALLKWSQSDLAEKSNVFVNTIISFERGTSDPKQSTLLKLRNTLIRAGVIFIDEDAQYGAGVRLKSKSDIG